MEAKQRLEAVETEDWGIKPVPQSRRRLLGIDYAILWGDLAVSLLVIAAGSLLVPGLSTKEALTVIVLGNIIGAAFLALAGIIGSDTGLPTMVSLRPALGIRGSYLPSGLNTVQLIGWAALEIIVMSKLASGLSDHYLGFSGYYFWLILFGVLGTAMAVGGPITVVRQYMQKFGIWIVLAAVAWLTFRLFDAYDFEAIWNAPGGGSPFPTFWVGLDLVISLPVSWLPLVCDYSRFAKSAKPAAIGTYIGYGIANIWFFALGALYVQALGTDFGGFVNGGAFVAMLVPLTLGWMAIVALLAGESDEVFANIYSTSVSLRNLLPNASHSVLVIIVGAVATLAAISLDLIAYETFLLLIGGIFVPLFGVLFADYFAVRNRQYDVAEVERVGGIYWYTGGFNIVGIVVWVLGFLIFVHAAQPLWLLAHADFVSWAPEKASWITKFGGTIPAFIFSFVAYWLAAKLGLGVKMGERESARAAV